MTKLKKSLSVLLSLVMLFTTLCFFVLPETGIKANAAAGEAVSVTGTESASYNRVDDVIITVPETIYMTPSADKTTTGQYYVNNTIKDGAVTLDSERAADSGKLSIYAPGATSATFQVVDAKTGKTVGEPKVTGEGTAIAFSNGYASKTDIKLESIATGLAAGDTATIQWNITLTYADKTVTYRAFSTLYAPYYQPVGAATEAMSSSGLYQAWAGSILWVSGIHSVGDVSSSYPFNGGEYKGKYYPSSSAFLPMLGVLTEPDSNTRPRNKWISSSASAPDATVSYVESSESNYHRLATAVSPVAKLTVDSSRYGNFNQIPNFLVGFMATDRENADAGYWFVSDHTGKGGSMENDTNGGSSNYSGRYNEATGTKIDSSNDDKSIGIKYNGTWDKSVVSGTVQLKSALYSRDTDGGAITKTAWGINYIQIDVATVNKTALRNLVLQATSINRANYVNTFDHFNIDIAYAAYVLGNPAATADQVTEAINRLKASTNGGKHPVVADWTNCPGLQINVYARSNYDSNDNTEVERKTVVIGTNTVYSYKPDFTFKENERPGYTFVGWNADRNATTGSIPADISLYDDDKSVYAIWAIKQYTMTFNTNGGTAIAPITKDYNTQISAPANPTKEGHTFVKWNISFPHTLTENITATAEWSVNKYSISFNSDGGTSVGAITQDFGTAITAPADPTKTGYTFGGWNPALPGTMPANNLSVKAIWTPTQYTITYDLNDEATGVKDAVLVNEVGSYTIEDEIILPSASSTNYDFLGWDVISVENGNWTKTHYDAGEKLSGVYGNVKLQAKWGIKQFTVTWKNWDGTVLETDTVSYGAIPAYNQSSFPTRAKDAQYTYTFDDWDNDTKLPVTGDIVFTAQYTSTINSYTVRWLNYDDSLIFEETYEYGEIPVFDRADPVRTDSTGMYTYTFTGWSPKIDVVTGNATYTAQYTSEINTYKITFTYRDANGTDKTVPLDSVEFGTPFNEIVPKDCVEYYYLEAEKDGFNHSHYKGVWNKEVTVITEPADFVLTYTKEENVIMYLAPDNAPATCEVPGLDSRVCYDCGFKHSEKIDALPHIWKDKGNSATCLEPGKIIQQCSRCQQTQEIDSSAKGHIFTTTTAAVAATCITDGSHAYKSCGNCGLLFAEDEEAMSVNGQDDVTAFKIEAQGHSFEPTVDAVSADCTTDGHEAYKKCSVCKLFFAENAGIKAEGGAANPSVFTITKLGHDYEAVVTEPTCTEKGFTTHTCSRCKDKYTDSTVAATGHKPGEPVIEDRSENVTCENPGSYNLVTYCSVCNTKLNSEPKEDKVPHDYVSYAVTENTASELCVAVKTCYSYGVYYKTCSMCGRSAKDDDKVAEKTFEDITGGKLEHTPATVAVIENKTTATCTVNAEWDEVKYCTAPGCGAETERTHQIGSVDLTKHGTHTRTTSEINVIPGTCNSVRSWTEVVTCDGCHNEISRTPKTGNKNALNHVASAVKEGTPYVKTPGTCISETVWAVDTDCTACNTKKIKTRTYKGDKDPDNHASEPVLTEENKVAATCVNGGSYQAVATCPDCNKELSRENKTTPVVPENHVAATYIKNEKVVAGTCTAEKTWDEVTYCSDCNKPVGEAVHKTGEKDPENHSGITELQGFKEATCGEAGYTGDLYRTCCEVLVEKGEIIPMLTEHTPGEAVKENEIPATETTDGEFDSVVYCSVCGTELSREHVIHKIERTIKFVLKDKVVEVKAFSGDTVKAPATPEVQTEDGFWHYFIGWDKKIKPVTGDATYTAIYTEPCDYSELERLEAQLKEIIADGSVDDETLEANKEEIEAVLAEIKKIYMDRNYRDVSEQNEITEVTDKVEAIIQVICPDLGSTLVIEGSVVQYTGQILALRAVKMPSGTEVFDAYWTSSDESIVFFANGKLYAVGTGTVTITAQRGTLTDTATITIVAGGNTRGINFTSVDNASFIIEDAYQTKDGSIVFWSDDQPIRFRVHANAGFLYEKYYVYINGEAAETDMDGYYTIPANSGDVRITIAGEMIDTGAGEGPVVTKWSFWDWLLSFFKKIGDFFRGLFS